MNKPTIKSNVKVKVKKKGLVLPVIASLFFFAVIIGITMNNDLLSLMGNSVTNEYVCNDGYKLKGNKCVISIDAYKLGDVNHDGVVNNVDVSIINDYIDSNNNIVGTELSVADVTLDGKLTKEDVNKIKFYLAGISSADIKGYVCPNGYELDGNKCIKEESAVLVGSKLDIGSAVKYNDSIWYILDNNDDYVTLLKKDYIDTYNQVDYTSINGILNNYASNILNDLKEVDGYKIRLINIDELIKLGFSDKTSTNYYEDSGNTPYWIGLSNSNYWVMSNKKNTYNNSFMVVNYEGNNYIYEANYNDYAYVRPVINIYKNKLID